MRYQTKEDFASLFKMMTEPLEKYYDDYGLNVGATAACYEKRTVPVEGFMRILWGLTPFFAGNNQGLEQFKEIYRHGFTTGSDKNLKSYWGGFRNSDQLFVEMAATAYSLLFAKDIFWDSLDDTTQDNLAAWLYEINNYELPCNNWQMFPVLVNIALKRLGKKYSEEKIQQALDNVESYYIGDGWYVDGVTNQRDYYIPFAFHFYCLIYAKVMEAEDPERCAKFKERAMIFAQDFIYWFADNGAALPYGRSLTYRFAEAAFWSACLIADVKPFGMGIMKGIITRHIEDWMKYPIFDNDGVLTIGYRYPNLIMSESYNAPGSPYWAYKFFALLMLPDDHPFWSANPEPLPHLDSIKFMPKSNMIITRNKGEVCAYVPGLTQPIYHDQNESKYSKFAYSTQFGFSVGRSAFSIEKSAPDSMLAFVVDEYVFARRVIDEFNVEEDKIYSKWSPFMGITVETTIIPTETGHTRKHIITSDYDCIAYDCGFAVRHDEDPFFKTESNNTMAVVENKDSVCTITGDGGTGIVLDAVADSSIMFNKSMIPAIKYEIKKGTTTVTCQVNTDK